MAILKPLHLPFMVADNPYHVFFRPGGYVVISGLVYHPFALKGDHSFLEKLYLSCATGSWVGGRGPWCHHDSKQYMAVPL